MNTDIKTLFEEYGGYVTRRQVDQADIDPHILTRLVKSGEIERIQRGVYRLADTPMHTHEDLLEVTLRIPYGVVCLSTALAFYGLTTFIPKVIHLAVPQKRKPPQLLYPPIKIHYFSSSTYECDVEIHWYKKHTLSVYSIEKTLVDLLRFNKKMLFAEGLKKYLLREKPKPNLAKLLEIAAIGRVEKRMRFLLEIMAYDITS